MTSPRDNPLWSVALSPWRSGLAWGAWWVASVVVIAWAWHAGACR